MSYFNTWMLLVSALMAPEGEFIDHNTQWHANNNTQEFLVSRFDKTRRDVHASKKFLQSWASDDHNTLNALAAKHKLPIVFDLFGPDEFGALSILEIMLTWRDKPAKTTVLFESDSQSETVKGLEFNKARLCTTPGYDHPVIQIKTKLGDKLCFAIADEALSAEKLAKKIAKIRHDLSHNKTTKHGSVIIPEILHDGAIDISWLEMLHCHIKNDHRCTVSKAVEYLHLVCDQEGCYVKAGAGLQMARISVVNKPYMINKPFYFWIEKRGCRYPILEAYIETDCLQQ